MKGNGFLWLTIRNEWWRASENTIASPVPYFGLSLR
jgi:hypothetical protein